jgi:ketosteroid isomerase-like protein
LSEENIEMKRLCLSAMLLLAFAVLVSAQDKRTSKPSKEGEQVIALDREWANAIARGDVAKLDQIFSDDMIVTTSGGTARGKAGELDDVRPSPDIKTYFFNTDEIRVRVYKGAAVLTGRARWRINYKGRDIDNERRYTSVYAKEKGSWRMVALQLTRTPPPQPPQQSPSQ